MKSSSYSLLFFICSLFATFAPANVDGKQSTDVQPGAKNLFIIVANGIRYADAFGNRNHLYTDNIWTDLRPRGTICTQFYNTGITCPLPAQASLFTGAWRFSTDPLHDTIRPALPTIFEYWKRKKPDDDCYFAANKRQFAVLSSSIHEEYGTKFAPMFDAPTIADADTGATETMPEIMNNAIYKKAVAHIFEHHPALICLNLDSGSAEEGYSHALECAVTGSQSGCEGEANVLNAYYESIILTDMIIGDLWKRIEDDAFYKDRSIVIFLSAHGRHTDDFHGFGDNCRGCRQLNFLIIGPGVKKDFISKKKRTLIDICPTVGALCGIPTPHVKGTVMKEILE